MNCNFSAYLFSDSRDRIDEILNSNDNNYEDKSPIPSRDTLTFTNGYFVNACALFIDIRDSKKLPENHKRPTLAKLYRAYISELVAVLKGDTNIKEVNIEGDCVWGVFDTPYQSNIDSVFSTAARAASLVDTLNYKLKKRNITQISVGIGMAYGNVLMVKAGYKGSGINDIVWMGDVVNEAAKLCSYANKGYLNYQLMVSNTVQNNLNEHNKSLLSYNSTNYCYHGNIHNIEMNDWLKQQK